MLSHRVEEDKPSDLKYPTGEDHPSDAVFVVDRPRFEFGDKVKVEGVEEPAHVIVEVNGKVHCSTTFGFHINEHNCGSYTARFFDKAKVSPWPEHETVEIEADTYLVIKEESAWLQDSAGDVIGNVDLETFMERLTAAVAKIRKP